jgi:hypothetical protein
MSVMMNFQLNDLNDMMAQTPLIRMHNCLTTVINANKNYNYATTCGNKVTFCREPRSGGYYEIIKEEGITNYLLVNNTFPIITTPLS